MVSARPHSVAELGATSNHGYDESKPIESAPELPAASQTLEND
ncbi:hypothetical protein F442_22451 [Phytophthora nicotianae P10297]|uniref:Uncharacterized protein n=1 Tax=Phytophthora nicotianae P10297 TaxID=1317064 RepID=W2XZJ4_PHYNI|nr:hypothetical protein F442_22451 [Phytophthora nicotianae P10297]